jgi:hypothetical protein
MYRFRLMLFVSLLSLPPMCWGAEAKLTAKGVEFFETKIRPVLVQNCYKCHSSGKEPKGGLALDSREGLAKGGESGKAIVPGNPEESLLYQAINHEMFEMPPGNKLAESVISDFHKWIEMGAPDPRAQADAKKPSLADARKFWSFQPLKKTPPPAVQNKSWPQSDLDRYILAKLEEQQLTPAADADRYTLIRRATFDLTGLPPTPEQVTEFVNDTSPDAYRKLVNRLLDSPAFGERWGRHWLDAVRYGESSGKERNVAYPYAWRYRDYVIESFNQDKPFDRFIREQVAGDLLPAKNAAERNTNLIATGFLAMGTKGLNERKPAQFSADVADEQLDVTCRAVLGMTLACARCHDHKFDPFNQADYYAVFGIFKSTQVLAGVEPGNNKTGYDGKYAYLVADRNPTPVKLSPEDSKKVQALRSELLELQDRLTRAQAALAAGGKKGDKDKKEKLETAISRSKKRGEEIISELKDLENPESHGKDPIMAVRDSAKPQNARINIRGEVEQLGNEVPRGVPMVFAVNRPQAFQTEQSGRLQLATWLVSRENPLAARVMANRVWSHLMGRGIVESVDNFGSLGDEPTHPELLDYLAQRLLAEGWSHKKLIREIMLSHTYQMGSEHHEQNYATDAGNRYWWRMPRRRLEAEAIRDAVLAVSGQLKLSPPQGSPVMKLSTNDIIGRKAAPPLTHMNHRSVYLPLIRGLVPESLSVFDMADPSLAVAQREVTTVPTQALFLMNSPFIIENAQKTGLRVMVDVPSDPVDRLERLYMLTLNRPPNSAEKNQSLQYLQQYDALIAHKIISPHERQAAVWSSLAQTLMATGEFRYLY